MLLIDGHSKQNLKIGGDAKYGLSNPKEKALKSSPKLNSASSPNIYIFEVALSIIYAFGDFDNDFFKKHCKVRIYYVPFIKIFPGGIFICVKRKI